MTYWTVAPEEWLVETDDAPRSLMEMSVGRAHVVLERAPDGTARVQRILSTDPADYLRPELQPGAAWLPGQS